jgi:hypothetical protein
MNSRLFPLLVCLGFANGLPAQVSGPVTPGDALVAADSAALLTPAQLDALLAPVALYPDPLIAILLPATTFPADIVLASRFVGEGGGPESFEAQAWDDSVKALARHPELLKWLDQNLDWTRQVGAAFARQPADVLASAQRLRAAAHASGNLGTSLQQTVIVERETIRIVPARPDVIYVPVYDPRRVYHTRASVIRYGLPYRTGPWLSYYCDWGHRSVVVIERPRRVSVWQHHPRWVVPGPATHLSRTRVEGAVRPSSPLVVVNPAPVRMPPSSAQAPVASRRIHEATTRAPEVRWPAPGHWPGAPTTGQSTPLSSQRRETLRVVAPPSTVTPEASAIAVRAPGARRGSGLAGPSVSEPARAPESPSMPPPGTATETEAPASRRGR